MRTGDPNAAVALYREALDRISQQGRGASVQRAALLEQLGDALRASGNEVNARTATHRRSSS